MEIDDDFRASNAARCFAAASCLLFYEFELRHAAATYHNNRLPLVIAAAGIYAKPFSFRLRKMILLTGRRSRAAPDFSGEISGCATLASASIFIMTLRRNAFSSYARQIMYDAYALPPAYQRIDTPTHTE